MVIIQHLLELLMIQSDKLAYLTDLKRIPGGEQTVKPLCPPDSEEHEVF